ncbi:hypothetical protein [Haloferax sp. KTX1]|uniref:hypothetical protein n=1 Tax=Haloferax sp. KTX1 TaxID=2600597 RepID=UPI0011DC8567|nr:hypothetical protein [Haloferax sp. KTX1]
MPVTPLPTSGPEVTSAAAQSCTEPTVVVDGVPVCTQFGPEWLVRLMFAPPEWLGLVLKCLIVAIVFLVALGYHRHGVDDDVVRESAENGVTWLAVLVLATTLRGSGVVPGGYVGTVVVAGVGGFAISRSLVVAVDRLDERRESVQ